MKTKKNRKIFVLDTSVLVYDATAFKSFQNCDIIIPIIVLEELDKVKKNPNESGKNARVATRYLDEVSHKGEIHLGIEIDNDCSIRIDTEASGSLGTDPTYGDNQILACTQKHQMAAPVDGLVTLISRDINLRIRARANGILAYVYNNDRGPDLDLYSGVQRIQDEEMGAALISGGELTADEFPIVAELYPNECIIITANDSRVIALGRKTKNFVKIVRDKDPWGLMAKNPEQQLAIDMLLDPKLPLVSIVGPAGGGKSLCALACGLELVLNARKYTTFSIYRPTESMGNDIGYLPGSMDDKLSPHYASIDDGFQFLLSDSVNGKNKGKDSWREKLHQYIDNGTITKEALSYIRGRSIANSFILIDEVQNLSKEEVKTIVTRVGQGSKIVLTGDPSQIDNPHLDATSNGLSYLIDKFQKSHLSGHITLSRGERSLLATEAAELL
jgi:PhoH-like ATPase